MNLQDQLRNAFPNHNFKEVTKEEKPTDLWLQDQPLECKYEKRKGKVNTLIAGYNGSQEDFKKLAKMLKKELSVGGSVKGENIIIQGDYRDRIMEILKDLGFHVKRVGG